MLSYKQELTAAGLNERLASKTHDTTIAGRYTFSNTENSIDFNSGALRLKGGGYVEKDLLIGQVLKANDIEIIKNLNLNSFSDLTTTGANSDLDVTNKTAVILLNSDLESISNISGKSKDKFLIIVNSAGADIELNHSDNPLNDTKIISSSGASIKVKDSSFVILFYCEPLSGWLVVNGGGSSEGSGVTVVASIEDRDNIPAPQITDGMLVVVQDVGNEEYATFQRRGASWYNVELCITVLNYADISGLDATLLRTGFFVYVSSENRMYQHVNGSLNKVITASSSDVITNKDIDGGTASNTNRNTIPRASTIEAAAALVRKKATLLYNDFTNKFLKDNGTDLKSIPDFGDVNIFAQEIAADNVIGSWTQNLSGITATFTKGTDSRLGTCYKLDITSASSGTGGAYTVRKDFSVPEDARGSYVELSYDYVSTVTKTGTCIILYDVTNSTEIVPQTSLQAQPDPSSTLTKGFINFTIPTTCATLRLFVGRSLDAGAIAISNQYFYFNKFQFKRSYQNSNSVVPNIAVIEDVKANNTAAQTLTASTWNKRDLNTLSGDSGFITLSSSEFTLPAGLYDIEAIAGWAYAISAVATTALRIYNVTDSVAAFQGVAVAAGNTTSAGATAQIAPSIAGVINISTSKKFRLEHYTTSAMGGGRPLNIGLSEVYAKIKITKFR